MSPAPYEEYDKQADAEAKVKWRRWQVPLIVIFAMIGGAGAGYFAAAVLYGIVGAFVGLIVGGTIHALIVHFSSASAAAERYTADWCAENQCTNLGAGHAPPNCPYNGSGFKQESDLAIQGKFGEYDVLFFNFSYWTRESDGEGGTTDEEHPYRMLRVTGKTLPIERLTFQKRGMLDRFRALDKLQGAMTPERPIELESVEFNKLFDLTIDDNADDIWIRRIFDPLTIADSINGTIDIPNIRYYDQAWWLVDDKHFSAKDLEAMKAWQARAAVAIDHLARVQNL